MEGGIGMIKVRCSAAIGKFLERAGTKYYFGYNGHGNWGLLDSLEYETNIQGIRTRSEDHAIHMADVYYRFSRRPPIPVVCTTAGPGNFNIVCALANAFYESSAMLVLAGSGPTHWFGRGGLQETYRYGPEQFTQVVSQITKSAVLVNRPENALPMLMQAYKTAISGRPGPVLVQVPLDVQNTEIEINDIPAPDRWVKIHPVGPDPDGIDRAADLICRSSKPFIVVSSGIHNSGALKELRELVERFNIPLGMTFGGKGAIPENHPLCVGATMRSGTAHGVNAAMNCDVLIGVGTRFNDLNTAGWTMYDIPRKTKLIHIDIDASEISRVYPTEVAIQSDAKLALRALIDALAERDFKLDTSSQWLVDLNNWKRDWENQSEGLKHSDISPIHYARLCKEASEAISEIDPETSVIFDTGNIMCFAPAFFESLSHNVSTNNTQFARMGWSCPGIIGAKLANPDHPAVAFVGDGSFMMTGTAIATAVEYDIPAVWIVMNNKTLQAERDGMNAFYGRESFCVYQIERTGEPWNPDFVRISEGLGASAIRVEKPNQIKSAIKEGIESQRPFVIDLLTDSTQKRHLVHTIAELGTLPFPWTFADKPLLQDPF